MIEKYFILTGLDKVNPLWLIMKRKEERSMSIVMKKKRKEPINKVAIKLACHCVCNYDPSDCSCGCSDTTPKYGTHGQTDASVCGHINYGQDKHVESVVS